MKKVILFLSFLISTFSMFAQNTPDLICSTPYIGALPINATSVSVLWNSTAAASYTLQYRVCADTAWTSVNNLTAGLNPRDTGHYTLQNLVSCKCYVVRIRANCSATEMSDWRSFEFRTLGCVEPCRAPVQLFAATRDSMASLNWSPTSATSVYVVQWKSRADTAWHTATSSINSLIINHLNPCNEYQFRVKTVCSATVSSDFSDAIKFKTTGCVAPCSTPRELRAKVAADRSLGYVTWSNTGARAYEVMIMAGDSAARTVTVTTNILQLANLATCKTYKFKVRSICGSATSTTPVYSEWSTDVSVNTEGCVRCESPRRLSYTVTELGAVVKWDTAVGSSISYDIQYMGPRDSAWRTISGVRGNQYSLTGLTACTWYMFRVKANCTSSTGSNWSQPARFQTKGCVPPCIAPKNLKIYVVDTVAVLSWNGTSTSSYRLVVTNSDNTFTREITVTGNVYTLTGLLRCKTYKVQLKTVCSTTSVSEIVIASFETKGCPQSCDRTTGLGSEITNDTVALVKFNMTGNASYTVQYRVAGTANWTSVPVSIIAVALPVRITGLQKCTTYQWRVLGTCRTGVVSESEVLSFITKGCPAPCTAVPRDLVTTGYAVDSAKFTWIMPTAGLTYEVRYAIAGTDTAIAHAAITRHTTNAFVLRGLLLCRYYIAQVRTMCPNGVYSDWITSAKFRAGTNCQSIEPAIVDLPGREKFIGEFGLYPNPGSESLQVSYTLAHDANVQIELMNLQGQVISSINGGNQEVGTYVQSLDNVAALNTGFYLVVIRSNGKVAHTEKWQKQ